LSRSKLDVRDFAAAVVGYCLAFSASVTSWARTVDRNKLVGGHVRSAHLAGLAVDCVYDGAPPGPEADTWLALHGLQRLSEGDHDHIMPADWGA
jgi:hypothetical protein